MPNEYSVSFASPLEKDVEFWYSVMKLPLTHNYTKNNVIHKIHVRILDFNKFFIYKPLIIFIDYNKILL